MQILLKSLRILYLLREYSTNQANVYFFHNFKNETNLFSSRVYSKKQQNTINDLKQKIQGATQSIEKINLIRNINESKNSIDIEKEINIYAEHLKRQGYTQKHSEFDSLMQKQRNNLQQMEAFAQGKRNKFKNVNELMEYRLKNLDSESMNSSTTHMQMDSDPISLADESMDGGCPLNEGIDEIGVSQNNRSQSGKRPTSACLDLDTTEESGFFLSDLEISEKE
jgi:hypothetical protein